MEATPPPPPPGCGWQPSSGACGNRRISGVSPRWEPLTSHSANTRRKHRGLFSDVEGLGGASSRTARYESVPALGGGVLGPPGPRHREVPGDRHAASLLGPLSAQKRFIKLPDTRDRGN